MDRYKIIWLDGSTYDKKFKGFDCGFRFCCYKNVRFRNTLSLKKARLIKQELLNTTNSIGQPMFWNLTIQKVDITFWKLLKAEVTHIFRMIRYKFKKNRL